MSGAPRRAAPSPTDGSRTPGTRCTGQASARTDSPRTIPISPPSPSPARHGRSCTTSTAAACCRWRCRRSAREALHASAIQADGRVIAFAAVSQTGKSTVAYGLSRRGYEQWADDGVVLEVGGGRALAVPLPFDVRLRPESSGMFGLDGSRFHQFSSMDAERCSERKPTTLGAICVLSRSTGCSSGSPVTIERLEPAQAFAPVLTHAHEFDPLQSRSSSPDAADVSGTARRGPGVRRAVPAGRRTFPARPRCARCG